jgi:hypothetical protein
VKVETKPWKIELPTRKLEIELMTLSSNYHVEMNPSDAGNNDRYDQRSNLLASPLDTLRTSEDVKRCSVHLLKKDA